jgi:hypothetical protein
VGKVAPASLDWALQRCMAKDPDERWQTARDLHAALERISQIAEEASHKRLWRQSDNVTFGQSRNVTLTTPRLGDARRTATDDASRKRPAGNVAKNEEGPDHAAAGS